MGGHKGPIQAAGAVVLRDVDGGAREVLVVHRPDYDDLSPVSYTHLTLPTILLV